MSRGVNINFGHLPEPRVMAWMKANNIDTHHVVAAQEVLVTDDHMAYVEFVHDADGRKVLGSFGCLQVIKVVPLVSAPENHGL
jgi:hypothetical protein